MIFFLNFIILLNSHSKMKQSIVLGAIVSTFVLLGSVQYASGAAVMSIDLGSEWIKVRG